MAERVGFEPTEGYPSPVFKTGALDQLSHLSCLEIILEALIFTNIYGLVKFRVQPRDEGAQHTRTVLENPVLTTT